ncbi:MAG: phosphoribosylanthranilate isomerase [Bacillota bacterium]|nr:phosphoribosylanthranilate isomerase [Bacillota bacterium]
MTRVMLCGSRSAEDIQLLVDEGADAIGLITEVKQELSCRLALEEARNFCTLIPPMVSGVLILTEERVEEICRMVKYVCPDAVQLHGFNTPGDVAFLKRELKTRIIKTLHFQDGCFAGGGNPEDAALEFLKAGADAILLDTYGEGKYGSTGRTFDWDAARRIRDTVWPRPLILAGGLHESNLSEAVGKVQPYAVDAFSSVTSDGKLSRAKVRDFIAAVKKTGVNVHDTR